jgi:cysteine-rich repeat protein
MGQCSAGYADCDAAPDNGCEVELATDRAHCGACGEACPDGETCSEGTCLDATPVCRGGADLVATSPAGDMVVCDHPNDAVCEQDVETLCPQGWGLCSRDQYINRNDAWNAAPGGVIVAEIYCRNGNGAGHFTLGPYGGFANLSNDIPFQCGYGSSRPGCTSTYGCNERHVKALCCRPTPSCGNGQVDAPEEACDDGNENENDDCLNSCAWRVPSAHGEQGC